MSNRNDIATSVTSTTVGAALALALLSSLAMNAYGQTTIATNTPEACSQAANFPDVSLRTNYIDYNLDGVTSWDTNSELQPSVSVTCADGVVSVVSNGVPNFDAVGNGLGGADAEYRVLQMTWQFPTNPVKAAATTDLKNVVGPIAVMVNGVQIYGPVEAAIANYADPFTAGLMNYCGGHVEEYHFHSFPECFFNQTTLGSDRTFLPARTPGVILGYALDGFPIKAPYEYCRRGSKGCKKGVREIRSAYKYIGTGDYTTESAFDANVYQAGYKGSRLDQCNGMTDSRGQYAYYATRQFPYYLACYTGTKMEQNQNGAAPIGP